MTEADLFAIENTWVGSPADLPSRLQSDLAALRQLPGVVDAYATNEYPFTNSGWTEEATLRAEQTHGTTIVSLYFGDDHAIGTLGLKLVAGRNFEPTEITDRRDTDQVQPASIIVTRTVADKLFPGADAVGRSFYVAGAKQPSLIVGIVDKLQIPWTAAGGWTEKYFDNAVIEPYHYVATGSYYLVRARPGQLAAVMQAARKTLIEIDRSRVLQKVEPVTDTRIASYRDDRGLAVILAVVCACLVAVTAFGIVGLTSYWVAQRRRQIGIRRALGATRANILRYFQTENLLIASAGALLGLALTVAVNLWMVTSFAMPRLQVGWVVLGALIVLGLGQAAVLWPALRAAAVPPALATRSA
jgi:putative ABC transport system permease protein